MIALAAQWVRSLIFASAFCLLMLVITPEGITKKALRFVCALVCIAAFLGPVSEIDFNSYSEDLTRYSRDAQALTDTALDEREKLNRLYIEDECRAYILDKAKELGIEISAASVEVAWSTDGFWYPVAAALEASCSQEQKRELERLIEAELGIACDKQSWEVCVGE